MKQLGFDDISQFLTSVGRDSLFSYYGVRPDAPGPVLEQAISERRRWAQGMQSNPKYRGEAVWLIRNNGRLKELLLQNRAAYIGQLSDEKDEANLEFLSLFIRGTMFSGSFSPEAEEAIRRQAEQLGISDAVLQQRIELLLNENGATRASNMAATPQAPRTPSRTQRPPAAPKVVPILDQAPAVHPSAAAQLAGLIHDAMSQGLLESHVLNQILADGQRDGLDEAELYRRVQRAIASHTTDTQGPPPRRPKQRPQAPVGRTIQQPAGHARRPATEPERPRSATPRLEAVRDLVDTLRGAMLQGVFGEPTLRAMRSRALSLGLDVSTVHALIEQARDHLAAYRSQTQDPYTTLGMNRGQSLRELQQGYRELRGWAWSHPDPLQCAGTSIRLDAAWCAIREAKSLSR